MKAVLINPNLVALRQDLFTTGIPYMPISLAYVAAALRQVEIPVAVIDAFGEKPFQVRQKDEFLIFGLSINEIVQQIPANTTILFIYASNLTYHLAILGIIAAIKQAFPKLPIVVLENTQAVTAYSLMQVKEQFLQAGADRVLTGEAEDTALRLVLNTQGEGKRDLENLPFPAWDLFPLHNYWCLHFAHGPQSSNRYLPLLTSRGCPFACNFCFAPAANEQKWRARSPNNVVDEIDYFNKSLAVREFHIEDLNPTVSEERICAICEEILKRKLKITWKIVAGTKAETLHHGATLDLMFKAGCRYISISPETGSPALLKKMGKPGDQTHMLMLIKRMHKLGIKSQACFVLGFPGETKEDQQMTKDFIHILTKAGVDEIVLSVITPVPGSNIYQQFHGFSSLSALNFSPTWRKDFPALNKSRIGLYAQFILWKIKYYPLAVLLQIGRFFLRKYQTKMEMTPYRALIYKILQWRLRLRDMIAARFHLGKCRKQ